MKKMRKKYFFEDERARIPFSVIGVFLVLGSSFTAVYVTELETEKAEEISQTIDFNEIENFLRLAEADMATALNLAGLKGLKKIGEKPVIEPEDAADEINRNRVKSIIMEDMNVYLGNSYRFDVFNNGRYAINVVIPEEAQLPIVSRDEISFNYVDMDLDRGFTINEIGPPDEVTHTTYWIANLPVNVDIIKIDDDSNKEFVTNRTIRVSTIITCRYNLLKELVDEYQSEISGVPCSLFTVCTVLFNIYSLARGLKHWRNGDPANVVDNKDLHPMVNTGLLLEQGFVFGSVDPMALVGLATSMGSSSDQAKNDVSNSFSNDVTGWDIDTSDVSSVLPTDDGSDTPTTDVAPDIDVEEIASLPLYEVNSIILTFVHNTTGDIDTKILYEPTEEEIRILSEEKLDQGYILNNSEKNFADIEKNQTTVDYINQIISNVYSAELEVQVERGNDLISSYESSGYTIDTGSSPWISTSYIFNGSINKPSKGLIQPGSILYGEFYYNNNEEVLIKILLNEYSNFNGLKNDVKDVFYKNDIFDDENLQDTIDKYKDMVLIKENLTSWLDDTTILGTMNSSILFGDYNSWVETEAWQSLDIILEEVKKIKIDSSITITEYPDPVDLLKAAKADILNKYEQNMSSYLSINDYKDDSLFKSTGKKAVYCVKQWYVNKVHDDIKNYYSNVESMLDGYINDALEDSDGSASADDVHDALSEEAMSSLQNQFTIPMGYDITLKNDWTESIRIAVDQAPDYLKPDEITTVTEEETNDRGEEFYALKLRNTCTLGPTGFPVLPPTPITPWIFTFNVWYIEVKGEYKEFKVVDTTDETHFDPLFGHQAQIYIRKHEAIKDGETTIGENTRLDFGFSTVAMSFVPPYYFMVGDTAGGLIESTKGW